MCGCGSGEQPSGGHVILDNVIIDPIDYYNKGVVFVQGCFSGYSLLAIINSVIRHGTLWTGSEKVIVANSRILDSTDDGITTAHASNVIIVGNVFDNEETISGKAPNNLRIERAVNVLVIGNIFRNATGGNNIVLGSGSATDPNAKYVVIHGNYFYNTKSSAIGSDPPMSYYVIVSNNLFDNVAGRITVNFERVQYGKIINNIFVNCSPYNETLVGVIGVGGYGATDDVDIVGNKFVGYSSVFIAIYDASTDTGVNPAQNLSILDNDFGGYGIIRVSASTTFKKFSHNVNYYSTSKRGSNYGKAVFSGDGSTTQFKIAHGLVAAPSKVVVTPCSADAAGEFYVTVDDTYIYVNYSTAPPSGTDNVCLYWEAEV